MIVYERKHNKDILQASETELITLQLAVSIAYIEHYARFWCIMLVCILKSNRTVYLANNMERYEDCSAKIMEKTQSAHLYMNLNGDSPVLDS